MAERPEPSLWQIIVVTLVPLIAVVGGFWSLADPRTDIRQIKLDYLTLREHLEFAQRATKDIERLQSENVAQQQSLISVREFAEYKARTVKDIERLEGQIASANALLATIRELNAKAEAINHNADELSRRIDGQAGRITALVTEMQAHERADRVIEQRERLKP